MNYDHFDRWIVVVALVLGLASGGALTFAFSMIHAADSNGGPATSPQ